MQGYGVPSASAATFSATPTAPQLLANDLAESLFRFKLSELGDANQPENLQAKYAALSQLRSSIAALTQLPQMVPMPHQAQQSQPPQQPSILTGLGANPNTDGHGQSSLNIDQLHAYAPSSTASAQFPAGRLSPPGLAWPDAAAAVSALGAINGTLTPPSLGIANSLSAQSGPLQMPGQALLPQNGSVPVMPSLQGLTNPAGLVAAGAPPGPTSTSRGGTEPAMLPVPAVPATAQSEYSILAAMQRLQQVELLQQHVHMLRQQQVQQQPPQQPFADQASLNLSSSLSTYDQNRHLSKCSGEQERQGALNDVVAASHVPLRAATEASASNPSEHSAPTANKQVSTARGEQDTVPYRLPPSRPDTLRAFLEELRNEDPTRIFVVRRINKLGFHSRSILQRHYSKYGRVQQVFVAHSRVKPFGDSAQQPRTRPGNLGIVVMRKRQSVRKALAEADQQVIDGTQITVHPFDRLWMERESDNMKDEAAGNGVSDGCTSADAPSIGGGSLSPSPLEMSPTVRNPDSKGQLPKGDHHAEVVGGGARGGSSKLSPAATAQHLADLLEKLEAEAHARTQVPTNNAVPINGSKALSQSGGKSQVQLGRSVESSLNKLISDLHVFAQDTRPISRDTTTQNYSLNRGYEHKLHEAISLANWVSQQQELQAMHRQQDDCERIRNQVLALLNQHEMGIQQAMQNLAAQMRNSQQQQQQQATAIQLLQRQVQQQQQQPATSLHAQLTSPTLSALLESTMLPPSLHHLPISPLVQDLEAARFAPPEVEETFDDGSVDAEGECWAHSSSYRDEDDALEEPIPHRKAQHSSHSERHHSHGGYRVRHNGDTLRSHLMQVRSENPECIFIARRINKLGFRSREILRHHYTQYGEVSRVLVAHSKVKAFRDSSGELRTRPGGLGLVVMKSAATTRKILALGEEHFIAGHSIRVQCFQRPQVEAEAEMAGEHEILGSGNSAQSTGTGSDQTRSGGAHSRSSRKNNSAGSSGEQSSDPKSEDGYTGSNQDSSGGSEEPQRPLSP
eukprot:TRINITY_DN36419_c0_g1_i1.p1 TRINITY_DN36419_c0_g1~~TRINITY_DN36419_c0_g1_i1.p1  ORF type:complete len:1021 (-),score=191.97 TRINITY_DN36419_c0_g1_i1:409-3471(-)